MKSPWVIAATLAAAPFVSVALSGQALAGYSFTLIADPLGTGGTTVAGVNNAGVVAGSYFGASGEEGFTDTAGSFTTVAVSGAASTVVEGINAGNTVIGYSLTSGGAMHGFIQAGASQSSFDAPFAGAVGTTAGLGINATGTTVGYFQDSSGNTHGFINSGPYTQIDAPAAANSTVVAGINTAGTSAGYYTDSSGVVHGFTRTAAGVYTVIDAPSATATYVTGINNLGQVTGYYIDASSTTHGFVLTGSSFLTVDAPGALGFTEVNGINDYGVIAGTEISANGQLTGFTAVPEPASMTVFGLGLVSLASTRRRRA